MFDLLVKFYMKLTILNLSNLSIFYWITHNYLLLLINEKTHPFEIQFLVAINTYIKTVPESIFKFPGKFYISEFYI